MRRLLTTWLLLLLVLAFLLAAGLKAAAPWLPSTGWPDAPAPRALDSLAPATSGESPAADADHGDPAASPPETAQARPDEPGAGRARAGEPAESAPAADAPSAPEEAPAVDRIAFVARGGGLVTIAPDGSAERPLIEREGLRFSLPTWSPDARRLAAIGLGGEGAAVYLTRDEARSEARTLYENRVETPFYLYWSPSGRFLGFLANDPARGIGLHALEPGTGERRLLASGAPVYWSWSDRDPRVLVHSGRPDGEPSRLGFVDIVTGARQDLDPELPASFRTPGISPSGRFLAHSDQGDDGRNRIAITDRRSAGAEPFAIEHRGQAALRWSPRGDRLAFISPRQAAAETFAGPLRIFDAESQEIRSLVDDSVLAFFWSPDGRWLAYLTLDASLRAPGPRAAAGASIQSVAASLLPARPGIRPVAAIPAQDAGPDLVLHRIEVDRSGRGAQELLRFLPSRSFVLQVLPFFDQFALSHRIWSPASDALVLPVLEPEGAVIQVVPIDGRAPRTIARGSLAFWSPR